MTYKSAIAALAGLLLIPAAAMAQEDDPVLTDSGTIVGERHDGVRYFRGVPFAQPPVGELRWAPPQPIEWLGPLATRNYALPCLQISTNGRTNGGGVEGPTAEDCLYLNVFAPVGAGDAPVMVWLYGGAGTLGAGSLPTYEGESFARNGVIVVTINYRLGTLGNFAHPSLTAEAEAAGIPHTNYALMDAIAALEWVRDNIEQFGGDANNVTLFGQSAGGGMVGNLIASPMAEGLFHKAIIQSSGTTWAPSIPLAEAETMGLELLDAAGIPTHASLEQLRAIPASKFVEDRGVNGGVRRAIDGRVVVGSVPDVMTAGQENDVPVIYGTNSGEGRLDSASPFVRAAAASGAPAWQYFFDYAPGSDRGAAHSAELRFVFNTLGDQRTPPAQELTDLMHSCWVAFASMPADSERIVCDGVSWPAQDANSDPAIVFAPDGETRMIPASELASPPSWRASAD